MRGGLGCSRISCRGSRLKAKKIALFLGLWVFGVQSLFSSVTGPNSQAHLLPILSYVEEGASFHINSLMGENARGIYTNDWAQFNGNYYSNKAPGTVLLGVPIYFILYKLEKFLGKDPSALTWWNFYFLNLLLTVFPSALAASLFFLFLVQKDWLKRDALLAAIIYSFGTLVFPFTLATWGHVTAASFLLIALYSWQSKKPGWLPGIAMGLSIATEFSAALSVLSMLLFFFVQGRNKRIWLQVLLGIVPPLCMIGVYQYLCFGNPFTTALSLSNPKVLYSLGGEIFFFPSWVIFSKILFSLHRGIFAFCPILLFIFYPQKKPLPLSLLCLMAALAQTLLISSFNGWHGGYSTGPRYLIGALPFLCLLLPKFSQLPVWAKCCFGGSAILSCFSMFVIALLNCESPTGLANPLYGSLYPAFFAGNLHTQFLPFPHLQTCLALGLFVIFSLPGAYLLLKGTHER